MIVFGCYFSQYLAVKFASSNYFICAYIFAIITGIAHALLGLTVLHDSSHCALSHFHWVWKLGLATFDFTLGGSSFTWLHQHFLGHHPYTNVLDPQLPRCDAVDPDVVTNDPDIRRIKPAQKFYNRYKYQWIYAPILYGLLGIKFRVNDILIMFYWRKNGAIRINPPSYLEWSIFIGNYLYLLRTLGHC